LNCFAARSITNGQFNEMKLIFSGLYSGSLFAREFILKSLRYCTTTSHCTLLAFFWDIHLLDLIGPSPLSNMYICTTERNINGRFQIFYILHPVSDMSYLFIFSSVSFQKSSRTEHRFSMHDASQFYYTDYQSRNPFQNHQIRSETSAYTVSWFLHFCLDITTYWWMCKSCDTHLFAII